MAAGLPGLGGVGSAPAAGTLGSAEFLLIANSEGIVTGLDQVRGQVQQTTQQVAQDLGQQEQQFKTSHEAMGRSVRSTGEELKEFHRALSDVSQIILGFTVADTFGGVFRQIGEAMRGAIDSTIALGQETTKLQAISGQTAQEASATIGVWERFGVSADQAERSFTTLSRAMEAFSSGGGGSALGGKAIADLEQYGLRLKDVSGNAVPLKEVMLEVFDALSKIKDPAERDRDAMAILGRSWQDLAPLIAQGRTGIEAFTDAIIANGGAIDEHQKQQLNDWYQAQKDVDESLKALKITLAVALGPTIKDITKDIADLTKSWQANKSGIQDFGTEVHNFVGLVKQSMPELELFFGLVTGREDLFTTGVRDVMAQGQGLGKSLVDKALGNIPHGTQEIGSGIAPATTEQLQALKDAAKEAADAGRVAAEHSAQAIKDAQKIVNDSQKEYARDQETELRQQEEKVKRAYEDRVTLATQSYNKELDAAKLTHEGTLASLKTELEQEDASYKSALDKLRAQEHDKLDAAQATHEAALKGIQAERRASDDAYAATKAQYQDYLAQDLAGAQQREEADLAVLEKQKNDTKAARQQADYDEKRSEEQQDRDRQQYHEAQLKRIKDEGDAAQTAIKEQIKAAQAVAAGDLGGIAADTAKEQQSHQGRLVGIQQEQQAAQVAHESILRNLRDETQALQDKHNAALKAITDEEAALQRQNSDQLTAINRQKDAEHEANQEQIRAIDEATARQKSAIDAQLSALQQEQQARDRAAQDRRDQENLAKAEGQLQTDIASGAGGDPTKILADQQALADAQFSIKQQADQRTDQDAQSTLKDQLAQIQTAADAQKQAIKDTEADRDRAHQELIQQLNDELRKQLDVLQQEGEQENATYQNHLRELQDQQQAENDRYQKSVARIQAERQLEDAASQDFQRLQASRTKAVNDTLKSTLDALQAQSDREKLATDLATQQEQARYSKETSDLQQTREEARHQLDLQRQKEDDTNTAAQAKVKDTYKKNRDEIEDTYNNKEHGLFARLDQAKQQENDTLTDRTTAETAHYDAVQKAIKATYESTQPNAQGVKGLIPVLEESHTTNVDTLNHRRDAENDYYTNTVQKNIKDKYYGVGDDAEHPTGVIPALKKQQQQTEDTLNAGITKWQEYSKALDDPIDKTNKLADATKLLRDQQERSDGPSSHGVPPASGGSGFGGAGTEGPIGIPEPGPVPIGPGMPHLAGNWEQIAQSQLGVPYVFGGRSPGKGFDCGGFDSWVYEQSGATLPMGTMNIQAATYRISAAEAQPGDVVLYNMSNPDPHIQHAAIYEGGGRIIEAGGVGPLSNQVHEDTVGSVGTPDYRRLIGWAMGGVITTPSLLTAIDTGLPYAVAGEAGWERLSPMSGAPDSGASPSFHFDVRGPSMANVATEIRRQFERTSWLHQGWR